jgi:RsiW-degrading membrane proteinase PrsW (M82 family)
MYLVILAFIALALSLVWYLLWHDHGRRLPIEALWLACGFGCIAMLLATLAESQIIPPTFLRFPLGFPLHERVGYFLSIGFIEEMAKFLPLALYLYRKSYFREHVDGVIYFAVCGLTFGLGENILYTLTYGTQVGMTRLLLTPFLHAATTAILGYYLVNRKFVGRSATWRLALALLAVPLLHSLYDFGVGSEQPYLQVLSLLVTLGLTQALFLYFIEANVRDRLLWVPALTRHYHPADRFCTACGQANNHQGNYCEACGHAM